MWSCMPGGLREVVLSFKFRQNRVNRFRVVGGRNLPFPILKASGLYNSLYYRTSRDWSGHTRLTHSYLLAGDDQPESVTSQCPLTVKHILIERCDFRDIRNKYFVASIMKDVFEQVSMRSQFY